jgi:hypothetical protein
MKCDSQDFIYKDKWLYGWTSTQRMEEACSSETYVSS